MFDAKLIFSEDQAITTAAVSTDYIDVKSITEVGEGSPLYIYVYVSVAFANKATTEFQIWLLTSSAAPAAADVVGMPLVSCPTTAGPLQTVGLLMKQALPGSGLLDHIRLKYYPDTTMATGKLTAFLKPD